MKNATICGLSLRAFLKKFILVLVISGIGKVVAQTYTIQVGTGSESSGTVPINTNYGYNYSQQIYTKDDIAAAGGLPGKILKLRFYLAGNTVVTNNSDLSVYLGNVAKSSFGGTTDWVPSADMTKVFDGVVSYPTGGPGWVEIVFDSDFTWDGVSNIVVAVDENTPGHGSLATWGSTAVTGDNRSIYYRSDYTNPDPDDPPTAYGRLSVFPNVQFEFMQIPCSGEALSGSALAASSVRCGSGPVLLTLEDHLLLYSGIGYQWEFQPDGGDEWASIAGATGPFYNGDVNSTGWFRAILTCGSSVVAVTTPVHVTVNPLPVVTVERTNETSCGEQVTFNASGAASYAWSPSQGLDVAEGAAVSASPDDATIYTVTGTDHNNCQSTATVNVLPVEFYRPGVSVTSDLNCSADVPVTITVSDPMEGTGVEYELHDEEGNVIIPWQSSVSFTHTPESEGAFTYNVVARKQGCGDISRPGPVWVTHGFTGDVSIEQDCVENSSLVRIRNAQGRGWKEEVWANDFSDPEQQSDFLLHGGASVTEGRAVITPSVTSLRGGLQFSNVINGNPHTLNLAFKLTADQPINMFGTGGADGVAWSFGDDADYSGSFTNGAGSKLRLVFDAADNGIANPRGIYLVYGYTSNSPMGPGSSGTIEYSNDLSSWKGGTDTPVLVTIDASSRFTLIVNGRLIFDRIQLPEEYAEADKSQWKHLFSAFTGGDAMRFAVDDVVITSHISDFVYGVSDGGSGSLPVSWQTSDIFADLTIPGNYDVWVAAGDDPESCHKMLSAIQLLPPVSVSSVTKTELTGCNSNDGKIILAGLVPNAVYQLEYVSSVSGAFSGNVTTDGTGNIVLGNLAPATYSSIIVSDGSCTSEPIDPVVIAVPVTPALLAYVSSANTGCSAPNGFISLVSLDFIPGVTYEVWYNGSSQGDFVADDGRQISLSGLTTGDYRDLYVVTAQQCASNIISLRSVTGVMPQPVIASVAATTPSDCNGANGEIQLSGTFSDGLASVSYRRNGVAALAAVTATGGTINLTGLSNGIYDNFSVTSGCTSNVWTAAVSVNPVGETFPATGNAFKTDVQGADVTVDYYNGSCGRIASLYSSDGSPGNVSVIVTVKGSVGVYHYQPYVGRYYDIETGNDVGGTVTLYVTDAEINQYNSHVAALGDSRYPVVGENGENLRVTVFHTSAPGAGPEGYDHTEPESISPTSVVRHASGYWEVTFVADGFSGFFMHTNESGSPLPVNLKTVIASNEGAVNIVKWSTADEARGDRFVVERSKDGRHFSEIGVVPAEGIPGHDYRFADAFPLNGVNYYRLKVQNVDGTGFYSTIVTTKHEGGNMEISIGPNPVRDQLTVRLNDAGGVGAILRLIDLTGRLVAEKPVGKKRSVQLSMEGLNAGIYIVQLWDTHTVRNIKVVKE